MIRISEEKPKEEVKEPEEQIDIKELVEKLANLESETNELRRLYDELIANMKEDVQEEELPSFEQWLRDVYDFTMEQEKKKKKKYPQYPNYPYPPYPKKKKEEKEAEEEKPKGEGAAIETEEMKLRENYEKIAESLRKGERISEQWLAPVTLGTHELVGHARDFCKIDKLLSGKPGATINIATVRDFDFGAWGTYGSPTLADETGSDVIAFVTADVQEAGVKFYMKNHLTEKADSNVVEKVNEIVRRAALRAEDKKILADIYGTTGVLSMDKSSESVNFDADWVAEIVETFQAAGVDVSPGDLVLFISPEMYEDLLKDIAGAMSLVFSRPDVIQKGMLTEFMGVTIRVVSKAILPVDTYYFAVAFKKGSYAFCPKRDVLIETDPDPANRQTLVVATTAAAGALANPKHGLKLKTPVT